MKINAGLLLLFSVLVISGCSGKTDSAQTGSVLEASSSSVPKRYELKSGIVYYEPTELMGSKSVETLYFDDYGRREARETISDANVMGMKMHSHKMQITDGDYVISYEIENSVNGKDEASKEATRTDMKEFREMAIMMGQTFDPEEMKRNFDYREEGVEEVAGVNGTKYSISLNKEKPGERVYGVLYKKISVKSTFGTIVIKAKKIEENVAVPASKFEVPAGYTIKDVNLEEEMRKASQSGEE
ncbi:hypothetical protein [Chlorobium phaeobacteroides]|jgi:hypothetical protein|uniref:Lipoprotein n=1 Tax=Chlorobium phaeobacteroides (strain DSM 266 / SMG 266 / 2430) TaxID=290317 RepID=A1BCJ5_CHLPD|nr:hypothetical protein [Chlorobium phaeobacteroides]ABL64122.1 hypothetical protein Cpha266_0052 [Chlorobium phaeobacteroides DSM 266]MBV5319838.1 hypothetical protein [Chlorobium phaeobacteroides]